MAISEAVVLDLLDETVGVVLRRRHDPGVAVEGLGLRVWGLGCGVQGPGVG